MPLTVVEKQAAAGNESWVKVQSNPKFVQIVCIGCLWIQAEIDMQEREIEGK